MSSVWSLALAHEWIGRDIPSGEKDREIGEEPRVVSADPPSLIEME